MNERNLVSDELQSLDFDNNLNDVIDYLIELRNSHQEKYQKLYIEKDYYGESFEYYLKGSRLENDLEVERRLSVEVSRNNLIKEKELKMLAELTAKYKDA